MDFTKACLVKVSVNHVWRVYTVTKWVPLLLLDVSHVMVVKLLQQLIVVLVNFVFQEDFSRTLLGLPNITMTLVTANFAPSQRTTHFLVISLLVLNVYLQKVQGQPNVVSQSYFFFNMPEQCSLTSSFFLFCLISIKTKMDVHPDNIQIIRVSHLHVLNVHMDISPTIEIWNSVQFVHWAFMQNKNVHTLRAWPAIVGSMVI